MKRNKTIVELANKYNTDKKMNNGIKAINGVLGHNYAKYYDNILNKLDVGRMLEIGVSWGSSIRMWDEFYDGNVEIYGIDINELRFKKSNIETNNIKIFIGDQSNIGFLEQFNDILFDLIIDDGSHKMKDQQISLKVLFKYLRRGGIYVIEDLHTSKYKHFHNSKHETTTIDLIMALKNGDNFISNYIDCDDYEYILNNIDYINIYENNTICFIKKI